MVHINDQPVNDDPHAPFSGFGASGNGVSFGTIANWGRLHDLALDHRPRAAGDLSVLIGRLRARRDEREGSRGPARQLAGPWPGRTTAT
jgi:hypothetical protein